MAPVSAEQSVMAPAFPSGPTTDPVAYNAAYGYDYAGMPYDAETFTPGAPAMTPA